MTEVIQTVSPELAEKIATQTCVLEIRRHEPSFVKKVASETVLKAAVDPSISEIEPNRLAMHKFLIARKELAALYRHGDRFFEDLKKSSLPGGLLTVGSGQYLIPVALIPQIKEKIDTYLSTQKELLDDFEERYTEIIGSAKERLKGLFDPMDYPSFGVIRGMYDTTYRFISNTVPEEIAKVSAEIYAKEDARIKAECASVVNLIQDTLREQFLGLVEHFADRLGKDEETGKPKRFHGSGVDHIREFVKSFADMNLTGDTTLQELVHTAEGLLDGVEPAKIRTDLDFRQELKENFDKLKEAADKLVTNKARKIILED